MKLENYIEEMGPKEFANVYKIDVSQVYRYMKLDALPSAELAYQIVKNSFGVVKYSDIFDPYFEKNIPKK